MTGRTGEKCVSGGRYHCQTHTASVITMKEGETFPMCTFGDGPSHTATWVKDETT
jgi:hypothetical protein